MPYDLTKKFVIAISSRALLDLTRENVIFEREGLDAYESYQAAHETDIIPPGPAFYLIKALLGLNQHLPTERSVEVVLISRNSPTSSLRIFNSIAHHGLPITRSAFTSGRPIASYLPHFKVDLFLSAHDEDVVKASSTGVAAAKMLGLPKGHHQGEVDSIRIAFDGDSVLFSEDSEAVYQTDGIEKFYEHETQHESTPLRRGPFAKVLMAIGYIQSRLPEESTKITTALITARNSPADRRVIRTLRDWNVRIDEAFFLGGVSKTDVIREFKPHIFFDDQSTHCAPASVLVPSAQVPSNLFIMSGAMTPPCPKCGSETVKRLARKGPLKGRPFFGCSEFPKCRGSVSIA